MPNEQVDNIAQPEQAVQNQAVDSTEAQAPAPTDLAEAFAQIRKADAEAAKGDVESGKDDGESKAGDDGEHEEHASEEPKESREESSADASADETRESASDGGVGGNADISEPVDYSPARQQIYQGVNQQAVQNVAKRFQDNGIRMWDIGDLYEKDEQTGRVTFKNPDDENRPFQTRKEAQDFVDSMNKQINQKFQSEVRNEQRLLLQQAQPALSMLDFVPVYQSMNDMERQVFDDLITPYAIRDNQGNIQGFNINLNAAAQQARTIASRFAGQQQQQPAEKKSKKEPKATEPAMDTATGTGDVADDEPKDLAEAFAKLNEQKKKGAKND